MAKVKGMKSTFTIKIDTEFEIDLTDYDFHGGESEEDIRKIMIDKYFDACGYEDVEIEKKDMTIRKRPKREDYQRGKFGEKTYQEDMAKWEQKFNRRYGS